MSGPTDWLRRRGEYPGPGVPAAAQPALLAENGELATELSVERQLSDRITAERDRVIGERDRAIRRADALAAEVARLTSALDSLNARTGQAPDATATQDRLNAVVLGGRLAEAHATINGLEAVNAQLRRDLEIFGRAPSTYPPGVGYVPGRGPHGPSGHDGEYAGKCYCGYAPAECDAYAEAERLYGHRVGEVSP